MDEQETRFTALEQFRRDTEDALVVIAHLEKRQSELIAANTAEAEKQRAQLERHRCMNEDTDKRIADLVSAIGALLTRG